ncbi:NADH-quinone oxidoreductase subunit L [Rubripirellula obstinata]|uniref:Probable inorganic carbon transporter subunit DabB n=1 Tax=Rubripirellula obstinata TaxID=406547 RepID=A0A5B1C9G8_9BACT|nr:proton-conducting transporter membrane subunit [Rubripirellula obstinata]KAA1257777.1 NADH-quinone oxidoreductase subunit L [Rubripirellula obstinata]
MLAASIALPAFILVCVALIPSSVANPNVRLFRRLVSVLTGLQLIIVTAMGVSVATGLLPTIDATLPGTAGLIGVHYDGVAALMLMLVSFVGWIICRYSIRYLDGESTQGRYFRWAGFTIGAVSLLVVSGNLLMFFGCWVMTSTGLHQMLLHYSHRDAARKAAHTKFVISRLGDMALIGAIVLIYIQFKTLNLAELFAAAEAVTDITPAMTWAGLLLVIGAITKSAQFPFHTWLPQTMETPTPVSALMHAGIVNAGGYLMIRTSPLLELAPSALLILTIIGAITACFGAVVMMTQTSIKKKLAYSTMAQMGFMMLQCGLGAFSAAMLHILAHSLYKAHSFLSSGSVMSLHSATMGAKPETTPVPWFKLAGFAVLFVALFFVAMTVCGIDVMTKPGGLLLGGILCIALTHWISQVMRVGDQPLLMRSIAMAAAMCFFYALGFAAVDTIIADSLPTRVVEHAIWLVAGIIVVGFGGMFLLQSRLASASPSPRLNRWYIHASNGFYFEKSLQRIFGRLVAN